MPIWSYWNSEKKYVKFFWLFIFGVVVLVTLSFWVHRSFFVLLLIFVFKMKVYYYNEIAGTEDDFRWRIKPRK